jgi:hypothetical protein
LEERKWLIELGLYIILLSYSQVSFLLLFDSGCAESSLPTNLTLLRASEVDELLSGNDEKYRALTMNIESTTTRT